jgi:hypothetical protein
MILEVNRLTDKAGGIYSHAIAINYDYQMGKAPIFY